MLEGQGAQCLIGGCGGPHRGLLLVGNVAGVQEEAEERVQCLIRQPPPPSAPYDRREIASQWHLPFHPRLSTINSSGLSTGTIKNKYVKVPKQDIILSKTTLRNEGQSCHCMQCAHWSTYAEALLSPFLPLALPLSLSKQHAPSCESSMP